MSWSENDARPVIIDYKREARSPVLQYRDRQTFGELTLCNAVLDRNYSSFLSTAQLVVSLHKSEPYELRWREGDRDKKRLVRPGTIHITPVGASTYTAWGEVSPEVFAIAIDQTMVLRIVENTGMNPTTPLPAILAARDPMARQLVEACEKEMSGLNVRMFTEHLISTLVTHIYRTYTSAAQPIIAKGGLTPKQTSRALAYVQTHLSETIAVEDLAAEVGLSANYFTETFKKTLGVTPYKYVLNQRVEKAKTLLAENKNSVAKIASMVGFASHKQFSTAFRKVVGVTPAQYQREKK